MAYTDTEIQNIWKSAPRAPVDEKREMGHALSQQFYDPTLASRMAQELPQGVVGAQEFLQTISKAIRQTNRQNTLSSDQSGGGRRSVYVDPNRAYLDIAGIRPKRGQIPPDILRQMRRDDPILLSIIQNLKNRAQPYAQPVERGLSTLLAGVEGFDFRPRGKKDHEELTPAEERTRRRLTEFLLNGGDAPRFTPDGSPNREDLERETFNQNLNLIIDQRYTFDGVPIELERTRDGRSLSGFYVLPGDTVHRVDRARWSRMGTQYAQENPEARFAQVIQQTVYTSYGSNDLYYDYVNAQDGLGMRGYGLSEIEMCGRLTIGVMNVLTHTTALFDRNAIPNSIMVLKGQINQSTIDEFAESWHGHRLGAGGEFMFPLLNFRNADGSAEILPVNEQPKDMAFTQYLSFLGAIDCSVFGIDTSEINLSAFGGNNAGLSSGKDTDTKLTDSRNRAFLPMMLRLQRLLNEVLSPLMGEAWEFRFIGLARQEPEALSEIIQRSVTVDELRTGVLGMQPLEDKLASSSLVNNPAVSQLRLSVIKDGQANLEGDLNNNGVPDSKEKPAKIERAGKKGISSED